MTCTLTILATTSWFVPAFQNMEWSQLHLALTDIDLDKKILATELMSFGYMQGLKEIFKSIRLILKQ